FHTFSARVGVTDDSLASCTANFAITVDNGTQLYDETLSYGHSQDLYLPVTNVLRRTVTITQESPDGDTDTTRCVGALGQPLAS
ncbi:MAG: hypothetical protein ACREP9_00800, partial [Candidatus Dormibacteraceae bacterium]